MNCIYGSISPNRLSIPLDGGFMNYRSNEEKGITSTYTFVSEEIDSLSQPAEGINILLWIAGLLLL